MSYAVDGVESKGRSIIEITCQARLPSLIQLIRLAELSKSHQREPAQKHFTGRRQRGRASLLCQALRTSPPGSLAEKRHILISLGSSGAGTVGSLALQPQALSLVSGSS